LGYLRTEAGSFDHQRTDALPSACGSRDQQVPASIASLASSIFRLGHASPDDPSSQRIARSIMYSIAQRGTLTNSSIGPHFFALGLRARHHASAFESSALGVRMLARLEAAGGRS
jgi:hypothetical protein